MVGFYSFFSTVPRGKHLVRVCLGTACYVRGGKQVLEACRQELGIDVGGTTPDGLFTLEVARCFGACGLAPTIMIDEDVHQRVKPQKLRAILAAYRERERGTAKRRRVRTAKTRPRRKKPLRRSSAEESRPRQKHGGGQARKGWWRDERKDHQSPGPPEAARPGQRGQVELRGGPKETQVVVHMGTCGIAAGARDVVAELVSELDTKAVQTVTVRQSGCIGLCDQEPMLTYTDKAGSNFLYVNLTREKVREIVSATS